MPDADLDPQLCHDATFSAVQGKRYTICAKWLQEASTPPSLTTLCIVLEPLRHLTAWFIRRAREHEDPGRVPPALDLLNHAYSPIVHAEQYLAGLLDGQARRLVLLWRAAGDSSLDQWCQAHPECARALRRAALVAAAGVYRRHVVPLRQYPWRLVRLADDRIPFEERLREAQEFIDTPRCCIPPGMARGVHSGSASAAEMLSPEMQRIWLAFGRLVTWQTADIEWRHGRNRARSHKYGQTTWGTFVARYITAEANVILRSEQTREAAMALPGARREGARASMASPGGEQRTVLPGKLQCTALPGGLGLGTRRAPCAVQLFRAEMIRRDRRLGLPILNPASARFWSALKEEFAALPPERKAAYQQQAAAMKMRYAHGRICRHTAKGPPSPHAHVDKSASCARRSCSPPQSINAVLRGPLCIAATQGSQGHGFAGQPGRGCGHGVAEQGAHGRQCVAQHGSAHGVAQQRQTGRHSVAEQGPPGVAEQGARHGAAPMPGVAGPSLAERVQASGPATSAAHPLAAERLQEFRQSPGGGATIKQRVEDFIRTVHTFTGGTGGLPARVTYPQHCGALCSERTARDTKGWHELLLRAFQDTAARFGSSATVSLHDALLRVTACFSGQCSPPVQQHHVLLVGAAAQWAHHKATQTFLLMRRTGTEREEFSFAHRPMIQPIGHVRAPLRSQGNGALHLLTEDELAALVMGSTMEPWGSNRQMTEVQIEQLTYSDTTLSTVRVTGTADGFAPIVVKRGGESRARAQTPGAREARPLLGCIG